MCTRKGERYYIRTLPHHNIGASSFEYMPPVEGKVRATYFEACQRQKTLPDDSEVKGVPGEAVHQTIQRLTELFAILLVHCQPTDLKGIIESQKEGFLSQTFTNAYKIVHNYQMNHWHFNSWWLRYREVSAQCHHLWLQKSCFPPHKHTFRISQVQLRARVVKSSPRCKRFFL